MAYDPLKSPAAWTAGQASRRWRTATILTALSLVFLLAAMLALFAGFGFAAVVGALAVAWMIGQLAGIRLDEAVPWMKGARSEAAVGEELQRLIPQGFTVLHDIPQPGFGNADHVVSGPSGVFLVETKHRRYEERDLPKAAHQAKRLHDELGVWVTAVICLDRRDHPPAKRGRVWVMSRDYVCDWIESQRNAAIGFDRLARWADGI